MMEYKGYVGRVEFDSEARTFHGEILDTRDVITFQGQSVSELEAAFRGSIDDYLLFCTQRGEEPDKPFSGQFVTRMTSELHRQISQAAILSGKSLNAWVVEQLQAGIARPSSARVAKTRGEKLRASSSKVKKAHPAGKGSALRPRPADGPGGP